MKPCKARPPLTKREGYREAFHHFDVEKVAQMTQEDIERLMQYDGIVKMCIRDR